MRDDAVLRRALPLGRGLGRIKSVGLHRHTNAVYTLQFMYIHYCEWTLIICCNLLGQFIQLQKTNLINRNTSTNNQQQMYELYTVKSHSTMRRSLEIKLYPQNIKFS